MKDIPCNQTVNHKEKPAAGTQSGIPVGSKTLAEIFYRKPVTQAGTQKEKPAGSNQRDANGIPPGGTGAPKRSGNQKKKEKLAKLARQREALEHDTLSPRSS